MLVKALSAAFVVSSLVAVTTATITPNSPCVYPFTDFVYSGCYADSPDARSLPFDSTIEFGVMTVEACVAYCKGNNYRYAGLEYYGQCFCGASVASAKAPETDCSFPCRGNSSEVCGGDGRLSVYQDPTFPDADDMAISTDYKSLGCFNDGTDSVGRALAALQTQLDASTMTTELCLNTCGAKGYVFAGTEFGGECWCGTVLGNGTMSVDNDACDMPCNGNEDQICGGSRLINLYVANALDTTNPCAPPVVSSSSSSTPASSSTPVSSGPSSSSSASITSGSSSAPITSSSPISSSSSSSSSTLPPISTPSMSTVTPCSIPTNTYAPPPPPTTTTVTTQTPAPTSSCLCATPTAWAGSKAVGSWHMPCVGCNDDTKKRSQNPFKLFNQKKFSSCPTYNKGTSGVSDACQDACKTQYDWCLSYANSCRKGGKKDTYTSATYKCRQQYADCFAANSDRKISYDGRCDTTSSNTKATNTQWYSWCNKYLSQWF